MDLPAIQAIVKKDTKTIRKIIDDEEYCAERDRETYRDKVPMMEEIVNLSLSAMNKTLKDITVDDSIRKQMISKVSDLALLAKTVSSINLMLRLELDKSTENVATKVSYQEAEAALKEMSKVDPVFSYTQQIASPAAEVLVETPAPVPAEVKADERF